MEEKRRLPLWMVGVSTAKKVSKPLDTDAKDVITKEEVSVVAKHTKPKAKGRTQKHKKDSCLPSDETSFLIKCETKRKKRGFVEKDVIGRDDSVQEVVKKKNRRRVGRIVEEPDPSRKKDEKSYEFASNNENQVQSHDEDDEDLTMDDVLSIAKEFVENDKSKMGQQKPSEGERELKSKSSYISSSCTGTSSTVHHDARSPMREETASHHNSLENVTSDVTFSGSRMTGDPAQDMLNLFLGPLLKTPLGKEEASSIPKEIILPHEAKNLQHGDAISDKPVTLTKKKSSLRDAVAMLLD